MWRASSTRTARSPTTPYVAELTGLLDRSAWQHRSPGCGFRPGRVAAPQVPERASERESKRGRRYQLIAINAKIGQNAWLDAWRRSHVHVKTTTNRPKTST
jgi:hypothetical protein